MAKSGFDEIRTQLGAGEDIVVQPASGDDELRVRIAGDVFPRIVFSTLPTGDVLVGNGASPPVSIATGGGPGVNNALPVYNIVTQYFADPTGVTDAASPINQAISDAHTAGGGWVFVPDGTYAIASADIVMLTGVTLITESPTGSVFVDNRSSGSTIRIRGTNQATRIERVRVQGVNITGNNPGTNRRLGIELKWAQQCVVTESSVTNSGIGVDVYGSEACTVTRNLFTSCGTTDAFGWAAVYVIDDANGHSDSIHITENTFEGCFEHDVLIAGASPYRPEAIEVARNLFHGTHIRGNRVDIRLAQNCRVTGNLFYATSFDSGYSTVTNLVYVAGSAGVMVFDNGFVANGVVLNTCVNIDATSVTNTAITVQANKLTATSAIATAMIYWHNTAPAYNLRGTDLDNEVTTDTANSPKHVGAPNTISATQMYGPINLREYAIGDGVAYDGPAVQAWLDAIKTSGRQGRANAGSYLCQSDVSTPTLLVVDKATGHAGQTLILGDGDGSTQFVWNVGLGLDVYGNPNSCFTPLNCGKSQSVEMHGVGFQGASDGAIATLNPNNTPIPITTGFGPRIANRVHYDDISSRRFHTGFVVDGQINSGQYQCVSKVNGAATVTVDTQFSPAPPATLVGMAAVGSGIPNNTTVVSVVGNVITLSNTINNGAGTQPLDLACFTVGASGASRVQNTDHWALGNVIVEQCRQGLYVRRNSGVAGTGSGTADFTIRKLDIGRCQWAGIVCSEDGYMRDVTADFIHIANTPYSVLKEGRDGIAPSQLIFLTDIWCARFKSEGAGNYAIRDISGLSLCQDWTGFFEINGGIEINGQKTHKFIGNTIQDHTYKPFTGTATRDASARITVALADSSVVAVGKMIAVESQNQTIGGHGGDASFVDCAVVESIPDGTHFTALVGAQAKNVTPVAFGAGVSTVSIAGNPNVKNQDIGATVTGTGIAAGTFVGAVSFTAQTMDLVDSGGAPIVTTGTNDGTHLLTLALPAQATVVNVRFGFIGAIRLGDLRDINATFSAGTDPTTENISPEMYWDLNTIRHSRPVIASSNDNFPDIDIRASNTFTATNTRFIKGDGEAFPAAAAGPIFVGDPLVFASQGTVVATGAAETAPFAGFARQGGHSSGLTTVELSPFAAVNGQAPFVVVSRPWLMVQDGGPNANAATVDGGGVNCVDSTPAQKYLVLSAATASRVEALPSLATGRRVVAISMTASAGTTGHQKVDVDVIPHSWT